MKVYVSLLRNPAPAIAANGRLAVVLNWRALIGFYFLFFSLIFSRPYLSNGRVVVMVVVRPSVCLSVTDVLWLNGAR